MLKISEHIYVLEKNDDTDEPYLYYVSGKDLALEIDAGYSPYYYLKFIEELKALKINSLLLVTDSFLRGSGATAGLEALL